MRRHDLSHQYLIFTLGKTCADRPYPIEIPMIVGRSLVAVDIKQILIEFPRLAHIRVEQRCSHAYVTPYMLEAIFFLHRLQHH